MAAHEIPVLPDPDPKTAPFVYINEGAANIVFALPKYVPGQYVRVPTPEPTQIEEYGPGTPPPSEIASDAILYYEAPDPEESESEASDEFDNKNGVLLRLRKDLPTTISVAVNQEAWERLIAPLFRRDQLVEQSLVRLGSNTVNFLNNELRDWDEESAQYDPESTKRCRLPRPAKRRGVYLADDEFGLVITDMREGPHDLEVLEFKPKWLAQSPSAPENSVRCRQCARVGRNNAELARKGEPLQKSFCPLDLNDFRGMMKVLRSLLISDDDETVFRLSMWLSNDSKLLERLRDVQMMLDPIGVLDNDKNDENFRAAMTLRDCTVFIRLPKEEEEWHLAEARIGDLDLKSPDKAEYWKETERALIDEGWYAGTERLSDQQPMTCLLSPDRDDNAMERNFPIPYRANERRHYSR